jgi:NADH:ubiquinone oxidoreductase subunit 4 (subunit M)
MSAYYALRLYQRTMHNRPASQQNNGVASREIGLGDGLVLVPLVLCIIGLALYPQLVLKRTDKAVTGAVAAVNPEPVEAKIAIEGGETRSEH